MKRRDGRGEKRGGPGRVPSNKAHSNNSEEWNFSLAFAVRRRVQFSSDTMTMLGGAGFMVHCG